MKVSCIYATARQGKAMIGREEDHIELYLDCLEKQTLPAEDFEVILADCYYKRRARSMETTGNRVINHVQANSFHGKRYPFNILHFQVKSPWLDRGLWAGQAPWNQGAMLASGELLVLFGDCCEPPPDYLERIWKWYNMGYWCMGLVLYKKDGKLFIYDEKEISEEISSMTPQEFSKTEVAWSLQGVLKNLQELKRRGIIKDVVRDSRWPFVEQMTSGVLHLTGGAGANQFHGYSAIPLDVMLKVNGFDENFDGDKALGDVDMGIRLLGAGYDNTLVLDRNVWIFENAHYAVPEDLLTYRGPSIRSNYSLLKLNESKNRWRANSYTLTKEEVDFICEHAKDWGFRDIDQRGNQYFQWWLENQPYFDLKELRYGVQDKLQDGLIEIPDYYVWWKK